MTPPDIAPPRFPLVTRLPTGEEVTVRAVLPEDAGHVRTGFDQLSEQSRFFRFLNAHPALTESDLARIAAGNDADHMAIGALTREDHPAPMGIARYIRFAGAPERAEMAVTIVDRFQRRGLGRLLVTALGDQAVADGITCFVAFVHARNEGMLALLRGMGARTAARHGSELELHLPLPVARKAGA